MTFIPNSDFFIDVAQGKVTGHTIHRVIARNSDVDVTKEDIWFNGGTLVYLSAAEKMNIVSTSTSDTSAGTGARTVLLSGTDSSYNEITETITMNGTSNVLSVNNYLRVNLMEVVTAGSGGVTAGAITATAQTAGTVQANMPIGENRTGKSHYTIPLGKTAYLVSFLPSMAAGKTGADVALEARPLNEVFRMVTRMAVQTSGTSAIDHVTKNGTAKFVAKTDIKVVGTGQANDQDVFAEYILILIDD